MCRLATRPRSSFWLVLTTSVAAAHGALALSLYVLEVIDFPIIMLTLLQGPTGARQPTEEELQLATLQGKAFYEAVAKAHP